MLFAAHCRLINGQSALGVSYSCAYPDPITHLCEESAAPAVEEEEEEGGGVAVVYAVFWLRESNVATSVRLQR